MDARYINQKEKKKKKSSKLKNISKFVAEKRRSRKMSGTLYVLACVGYADGADVKS
jgi:hypothetical protein